MLGPIGMQELIIIFVIALIVFGPRKLPQLGKSLGRSIAEFKRASNELRNTLEDEIRVEETRKEILEPIERIQKEAKDAVDDITREEPEERATTAATSAGDREPSPEAEAEAEVEVETATTSQESKA